MDERRGPEREAHPTGDDAGAWPARAARFAAALTLGAASLAGLGLALWRGGEAPGSRAEVATHLPPGREGPVPGTLDLNSATRAELEMLPGVGPALAERIIAERTAAGAFASVDDLDRVKGIGPRTLERLRGLVRVSGGDGREEGRAPAR
jgi:competence ComEA-like helix-hairpin-helix protein